MTLSAPSEIPPLWDRSDPDPHTPVLVAGLAATAILGGTGEFRWPREARGGVAEWGGVYAEGCRLTGRWTILLRTKSSDLALDSDVERVAAYRSHVESVYRIPGGRVTQLVCPGPTSAVTRQLRLEAGGDSPLELRVASDVEPFLAPDLLEGIKPYDYRVRPAGPAIRVDAHGLAFDLELDPKPDRIWLNGRGWGGAPVTEELQVLRTEVPLHVTPGDPVTLRYVIRGGREERMPPPDRAASLVHQSAEWPAVARQRWTGWQSGIPSVSLPDAPDIEEAYRLATGALHALYYAPEPELTGLVAGYPWYRALWYRDIAWMLPAVLWMGDFSWADRSLRDLFRFQALTHIPVLGASPGELPMQLSPGPLFLYGTSDTTLYYPGVVERCVRHSGQLALARDLLPRLERIAAWAEAKVDPRQDLLHNGGEVAQLEAESAGIGRVHYGIDAVDTTIWDSADRRDHAIDVQVLWAQALAAIANLDEQVGSQAQSEALRRRSEAIRQHISRSYPWPEEGYLFDSLRCDGTPVRHLRPNALRAVSAGIFGGAYARALVARATRDDLTTPWGVRTLSRNDAGFDPQAYHDGQVWTIADAWAADAAFAAGMPEQGVDFLRLNGDRLRKENGLANECYRGDRDEPYDSCFLLGFSVAPFLSVIFDRLFGLAPDMTRRLLSINPSLPSSWQGASVAGLRLGDGRLDLDVRPDRVVARWNGPEPLVLVGRDSSVEALPGAEATLPLRTPPDT